MKNLVFYRWKSLGAMLGLTFTLLGCGYHLRQAPLLPFTELVLPARNNPSGGHIQPDGTHWVDILQQELGVSSPSLASPGSWRLVVMNDIQQRQIASLANDGTVREYRLYRQIKVQLYAPNQVATSFAPFTLEVFRDLPYLETQRAAKELEEGKLWSEMEIEIGQRIARRIIWQTEKKTATP